MKLIKLGLISLASLLLVACLSTQREQLAALDDDDYGIGGTGIVGSVTGFGSIFVNGVEVEITRQTRLSLNGQAVDDHDFAIGETVEVLTQDANPYTDALQLNIRHEIIGPVSDWNQATAILEILGQQVQLVDHSGQWQQGQTLAVSGYRDANGIIQARHVKPLAEPRILLRGEAEQLTARIEAAGYTIADPSGLASIEGPLRLTGRLNQSRLEIERLNSERLLPYAGIRHWKIEGFAYRYGTRWGELSAVADTATANQPLMFEVRLDQQGRAKLQIMDRTRLPQGAQQYRGPNPTRFGIKPKPSGPSGKGSGRRR